jgi:gluconate 5-dehydrogenase
LSHHLFDLTGRTALVTGSTRGIGLTLARGLAAAGARVVVNGRDPGTVAAVVAGMPGARELAFDVTDGAAVRAAIDSFEAGEGAIDILVNNAGIQHRAPLHDFPEEAFRRVIDTNLTSVFLVAQAVARHMIVRRRGRIINIGSATTLLARPSIAPYGAAKAGIGGLTRGMAADWARHGLNCNAIAPGYFQTPMNVALTSDPAFNAWIEARTPAGRWGRIEELQGACIFLASEAASFVNGHVLYVDGGITATL